MNIKHKKTKDKEQQQLRQTTLHTTKNKPQNSRTKLKYTQKQQHNMEIKREATDIKDNRKNEQRRQEEMKKTSSNNKTIKKSATTIISNNQHQTHTTTIINK